MSSTVAANIDLGEFNIGSQDRLRVAITKDGVPWDLSNTNSVVTFTFRAPDRATFTRTCTIESPGSAGVAHYDTTTVDLTKEGWWSLGVTVYDGSITKTYPGDIGFHVNEEPD